MDPAIKLLRQILGALNPIAGMLNNLIDLARGIDSAVAELGTTLNLQAINTKLDLLQFDLANLQAAVDADWAASESNELAIITAVSALPQVGDPVTLPTPPPTGYGQITGGDIAAGVWYEPIGSDTRTAAAMLADASGLGYLYQLLAALGFAVSYFRPINLPWPVNQSTTMQVPAFDPADIAPGETLLDVLTRQNPTAVVSWLDGVGGHVEVFLEDDVLLRDWATLMDGAEFNRLFQSVPVVEILSSPVVWPGLDGVVLGEVLDIDGGVTISGPLHGVIIDLTGVPDRMTPYIFGDRHSYRNVGALAFQADNGYVEYIQALSFDAEVYSPKAMRVAASCHVRPAVGVTGTVQAWSLIPP